MNIKALIKKYEAVECVVGIVSGKTILKTVLRDLQQLDEPQPVKVPQFVADFIAEQKKLGHTLSYSIDASMSDRVAEWYWDNSELFALAWIFGYEVEEEKKFFVKIKCLSEEYKYLNYFKSCREWLFSKKEETKEYRTAHTRKELEEAGFGEVFNSPLFEVLEVE